MKVITLNNKNYWVWKPTLQELKMIEYEIHTLDNKNYWLWNPTPEILNIIEYISQHFK